MSEVRDQMMLTGRGHSIDSDIERRFDLCSLTSDL